MIQNSDISETHGGTRTDLKSHRLTKKRNELYKLLDKRDDLLTKLCRVHLEIRKIQKSIARLDGR